MPGRMKIPASQRSTSTRRLWRRRVATPRRQRNLTMDLQRSKKRHGGAGTAIAPPTRSSTILAARAVRPAVPAAPTEPDSFAAFRRAGRARARAGARGGGEAGGGLRGVRGGPQRGAGGRRGRGGLRRLRCRAGRHAGPVRRLRRPRRAGAAAGRRRRPPPRPEPSPSPADTDIAVTPGAAAPKEDFKAYDVDTPAGRRRRRHRRNRPRRTSGRRSRTSRRWRSRPLFPTRRPRKRRTLGILTPHRPRTRRRRATPAPEEDPWSAFDAIAPPGAHWRPRPAAAPSSVGDAASRHRPAFEQADRHPWRRARGAGRRTPPRTVKTRASAHSMPPRRTCRCRTRTDDADEGFGALDGVADASPWPDEAAAAAPATDADGFAAFDAAEDDAAGTAATTTASATSPRGRCGARAGRRPRDRRRSVGRL